MFIHSTINERIYMREKDQTALTTGDHGLAKRALLIVAQGARLVFTGGHRKTLNLAVEELDPRAATLEAEVLNSEVRKDVFAAIKKNFDGGTTGPGFECLAISSTDRGSKSTIIY
jgi:hypothetical protein